MCFEACASNGRCTKVFDIQDVVECDDGLVLWANQNNGTGGKKYYRGDSEWIIGNKEVFVTEYHNIDIIILMILLKKSEDYRPPSPEFNHAPADHPGHLYDNAMRNGYERWEHHDLVREKLGNNKIPSSLINHRLNSLIRNDMVDRHFFACGTIKITEEGKKRIPAILGKKAITPGAIEFFQSRSFKKGIKFGQDETLKILDRLGALKK